MREQGGDPPRERTRARRGGGRRPADELLRDYLRAGDAQDAALADLLHDDLRTHGPGGEVVTGVRANLAVWRAAHEGLSRLEHRVETVIAAGEVAAARVEVHGVHAGPFLGVPPTGAELRVAQALFARCRDGRIAELWEVVDTGSGLRQLGVLGDQPLAPG